MSTPLLPRCLQGRHPVKGLVQLIEQVPARAAMRLPIVLDRASVGMIVLWTLLRWERTFLLVGLEEIGVDMWGLTRDVDQLLKDCKEQDASGDSWRLAVDPRSEFYWRGLEDGLNLWLDAAEAQAQALGHAYLGAEHLLLALLADAPPPLAQLFAKHDLDHGRMRQAVLDSLARGVPAETPVDMPPAESKGPVPLFQFATAGVGVPRRFGLGILLLITAMFAVLFAALQTLGAHPVVFVMVVVLFAGVGLGQMLLYGGKQPRAASVWTGLVLFPIETLAALIYLSATEHGGRTPVEEYFCLLIVSVPLGAGFGYLAGGLSAGVFFLLDWYAKKHAAGDAAKDQSADPFGKTDEEPVPPAAPSEP